MRFPDSVVDGFDQQESTQDFDDHNGGAANGASAPLAPPTAQSSSRPVYLHAIFDESSKCTVKLFNLRDVGDGVLERVLVHPGHQLEESVKRGFTCRAACWNTTDQLYSFNGRVCKPIDGAQGDFALELPPHCAFVEFHSDLPLEEEVEDAEAGRMPLWQFKGDRPTIAQFLEGMGETEEFEDPETARPDSELPSDAVKYKAAPEYQVKLYGRARRPAAPATMDTDNEEEDGDTTDSGATSEDEDDDSSDGESKNNPMLMKLKANTAQPVATVGMHDAPDGSGRQDSTASTPRADVTTFESVAGPASIHAGDPAPSVHSTTLPDYDRSYAKVDKNGLIGQADWQAKWDNSNPLATPRKRNKHGIARRMPSQIENLLAQPTSGSSAPMSLSTGSELQEERLTPAASSSFSSSQPIAMLDDIYDNLEPEQPWANRTQSAAAESCDLIDTSIPVNLPRSRELNGSIRPPPGLGQSFGQPQNLSLKGSSAAKQSKTEQSDDSTQDLIDLAVDPFDEPVVVKSSTKVSWDAPPLKPTVKLPISHEAFTKSNEDEIVERMQDATNQQRPVRYTMRQKASKKKKGSKAKKSAPNTPKVQLPKPEPPPPPKPKAVEETVRSDANTTHFTGRSAAGSSTVEVREETPIEKLLRQVESLHGRQDVELQVSFGTLLVRSRDQDLGRGNWNAQSLERQLQAQEQTGDLRTNFFERLTTTQSDAAYMVNLLPGALAPPRVEYGIELKTLQGHARVVRFDQSDRKSFAVFALEEITAALYMHYPIHVHDAQSKVIRSELALDIDTSDIETLVKSIHSIGQAPSFKARVPTKAFSIEQVQVKKVFAKQVIPGVRLQVTEVQDLKLDALEGSKNFNLQATAAGRAAMVDNHRLWYECSLHLAPLGSVEGGVLQQLVDQMVAEIDGVGYGNEGPYVRAEIEEMPEPEIRFW